MRRSFIALAVMAGIFTGSPSLAQAPQQAVRVGFSYASPSWSWYDVVSGANNGFMVDLMAAVGKDAGFQVSFAGASLDDLPTLLTTKRIDVIATAFTRARDPDGVVDFSIPVWVYGEAPLVRRADTTVYRSVVDLTGRTVLPGNYEPQLRASGVRFRSLITGRTTAEGLALVRSGQADMMIFPMPMAAYLAYSGAYPDLVLATDYVSKFTQPISIGVRKGDAALLDRINVALTRLMADGTVRAIWARHHLYWTPPK